MSNAETRELAKKVVELENRVNGLSSPQLGHSSLENGSIPAYNADGVLVSQYGLLYDGTFGTAAFNGPVPPTPTAATFTVQNGGVLIRWDGLYASGSTTVAPGDFSRAEVHVGPDPLTLGLLQPVTTIETPRGGEVFVLGDFDTDLYARLVIRTTSGARSLASVPAGPFRIARLTAEDLDVDFEALRGTRVFYGSATPVTDKADLWLKEPENVAHRYDPLAGIWVKLQDQGIVAALQEAQEASAAAEQAGLDALAAKTTAERKIEVYRQSTAPTGTIPNNYLWIDSDDGKLYVRQNGAWVLNQDASIQTAIDSAATAQATADGKMRIFVQITAPTGLTANDVGDLWIDAGNDNRANTWTWTNGVGAWTPRYISTKAIFPKSLVASDVVATGTITAALLEATMVLTNTVIAGPPLGDHARLTSTGVFAYAADPIDGVPDEVARFGRTSGGRDPATGRLSWQIDEKGIITCQRLMSADGDPSFGGTTIAQRDWERPWGLVGYVSIPPFEPPAFTPATPTELGICELAFDAVPGREYKLVHDAFELSTDYRFSNVNLGDRGTAMVRVRRTTNGTVPYTDTPDMPVERMVGDVKSDYSDEVSGSYLLGGPSAPARNPGETFAAWQTRIGKVRWRLLVSFGPAPAYNADNSSTGIRWIRMGRFTPARVWIEDVGPQRPNIGRLTDGIRPGAPPVGQPAPPPPAPKVTRTVDYPVTWSGSWPQSNNWSASHRSGWIYQGRSDGYDSYGAQMGAWGWDQGAVRNDLQGAEINRVEIYMFAYHWHWANGGTARIGWNRGTGTGGSFPGNFEWFDRNFGRGQGQWIDITGWGWRLAMPAGHVDNMTGIGVGVGGDHNLQYYGYFAGLGDVPGRYPALRVTFTK